MSSNTPLPKFWTEDDVLDAIRAADNESYTFLAMVAVRILARMKAGRRENIIAIVCGPITNGGTLPGHEVMKNLSRFDRTIEHLESCGLLVFNQLPFENYLFRIRKRRPDENPDILLESFYRPIFESGMVDIAYFLPGWQASHGARWENNLVKRLGMPNLEDNA